MERACSSQPVRGQGPFQSRCLSRLRPSPHTSPALLYTLSPPSPRPLPFPPSPLSTLRSDFLETEIQKAGSEGQLFVVAAGNNGQNMDTAPLYPSSFQFDNVLSVASTNDGDVVSGFSNYGR